MNYLLKDHISQVVFTEFEENGLYHFAADWNYQNARYTTKLNKEVKKVLENKAKQKFGVFNGRTGSSVYVYL